MSSWKLLNSLIVFWNAVENPVFLRTTRYPPVWYDVYARLVNASGFMLVAGGLSCYLITLAAFYLNSLLVLLIPLMLLWTLLIGAGLSIAAAVFPALRAAHMAPVEAMRVEE